MWPHKFRTLHIFTVHHRRLPPYHCTNWLPKTTKIAYVSGPVADMEFFLYDKWTSASRLVLCTEQHAWGFRKIVVHCV